MGDRFVELKSKDIRSIAFLELIGRVRAHEVLAPLSAATQRVLSDERAPSMIERYLSRNALRIFLDADALNFLSEQIDQQWWQEMMLQYFVRHQASLAMIQAMFPNTTRVSIERLRAELGAPPASKAARVADQELVQIYRAWENLADSIDERQRYLEIHEQFPHHSLTTLFAVLNVQRRSQ
jgi:hypothetical protein